MIAGCAEATIYNSNYAPFTASRTGQALLDKQGNPSLPVSKLTNAVQVDLCDAPRV